MPSFFAALRAYLKTVPELSTLNGFYGDEAKPEPDFPFMIIDELFEIPTNNLTDSYYSALDVQFTIQARDKAESRSLAIAARKALWHTRMPVLVFDEGKELYGRERGQFRHPRANTAGRPEGDKVWQTSFDYTFLLQRDE
jgi:hypothetical protein